MTGRGEYRSRRRAILVPPRLGCLDLSARTPRDDEAHSRWRRALLPFALFAILGCGGDIAKSAATRSSSAAGSGRATLGTGVGTSSGTGGGTSPSATGTGGGTSPSATGTGGATSPSATGTGGSGSGVSSSSGAGTGSGAGDAQTACPMDMVNCIPCHGAYQCGPLFLSTCPPGVKPDAACGDAAPCLTCNGGSGQPYECAGAWTANPTAYGCPGS